MVTLSPFAGFLPSKFQFFFLPASSSTLLYQCIDNSVNVQCVTVPQFQLHITAIICFWPMHLWVVWAALLHAGEAMSTQNTLFS